MKTQLLNSLTRIARVLLLVPGLEAQEEQARFLSLTAPEVTSVAGLMSFCG